MIRNCQTTGNRQVQVLINQQLRHMCIPSHSPCKKRGCFYCSLTPENLGSSAAMSLAKSKCQALRHPTNGCWPQLWGQNLLTATDITSVLTWIYLNCLELQFCFAMCNPVDQWTGPAEWSFSTFQKERHRGKSLNTCPTVPIHALTKDGLHGRYSKSPVQ